MPNERVVLTVFLAASVMGAAYLVVQVVQPMLHTITAALSAIP